MTKGYKYIFPFVCLEYAQRFAFAEHDAGAGVDSAWEQEKLEARKMLAVGAARHEAAVPSVQCALC